MIHPFLVRVSYLDYAKNKEIQDRVTEILRNRDKLNVREEILKLTRGAGDVLRNT